LSIPRHILVLRFSALGDVAMTAPVLKNLLLQYPAVRVTMVSVPNLQPVFEGIERLQFYPADIKSQFKGPTGIYSLARAIKKDVPFDAIADLHDVVRTKLLRFFLIGKKIAVIDKGRKEKAELTRPVNKKLRPLKTGFQRYAEVFEKLGFPLHLNVRDGLQYLSAKKELLPEHRPGPGVIGVAPFARHAAKMYPLERMRQVVQMLAEKGYAVLLFGSPTEGGALQEWASSIPGAFNMAGRLNFADELNLISQLDLLVSMDSANMHLASLYGVPVISLWGGTHPWLGFYGWGQDPANAIQLDLPCRPSSVFGNKPCPVHGEKGCMQGITPQMVATAVDTLKSNLTM
jgi:ADP-heptose:LPS heptosyltransferase